MNHLGEICVSHDLESRLRHLVKQTLPPFILDILRWARATVSCTGREWEFIPHGWRTMDLTGKGWNIEAVSETQKAKWSQFLRLTQGNGPLGIAHEDTSLTKGDFEAHHIVMAYAYVLTLAARMKTQLSLLDWGGGIGHYLIFSRSLLPNLEIEYFCKDMSMLSQAGRVVLPQAKFIEHEEEIANRTFDLVLVSGSLQYSPDWKSLTEVLSAMTGSYLYITRLPIVHGAKSFTVLQRAYGYGYETEYLGWFFNREEFLHHLTSLDLELMREFVFQRHPFVKHAPEQAEVRGFLFRSKRTFS